MKFTEYRILSEATKDLYTAIGRMATDRLLKTKVDPTVNKMHDSVFGANEHHIEIPLKNDLPEKVKSHIESKGDKLVDDKEVELPSGRRAPISKYLAKSNAPKDVQDEHQNWEKNKIGNSKLVITRNPAEVASASTGTHWDSCARATRARSTDNVPAWDAMPSEIKHGTLMAMHVHKDAIPNSHGEYESKDVLGRAMIKKHEADIESDNPNEISYHRENRKYGSFPESAKKAVDEFTAKHYPQKNISAHKEHTLYDDDNSKIKINVNHHDIKHAFDPDHPKEVSTSVQREIVEKPDVPQHILDYAAGSSSSSVRHAVASKSKSPETLRKVFNHKDEYSVSDMKAKSVAAGNPHAPSDVIDAGVKHEDYTVREGAVLNRHATPEHIMSGLKDRNTWVQSAAANNINLNKEHINYIINSQGKTHKDGDKLIGGTALRSAVKSPQASESDIDFGIKHESAHVRRAALLNPKITQNNLRTALDSEHIDTKKDAALLDSMGDDLLHEAINHKSPLVREQALLNPNIKDEHIQTAINSPHEATRNEGKEMFEYRSKLAERLKQYNDKK